MNQKIVLTLLCLLLALLAWQGTVDDYGREYTDKGFKRALVTFAVARSLNGVISVAQGTEVALQPAGIGINFTPGQILDPVNDLIERFSWVMLASSTSLGLQKLLLSILSSTVFTALILLSLLLVLFLQWYPGRTPGWLRPLAYRMAMVLVVVRFCIPAVALVTEGVFQLFLEEQYTVSTQRIEQTTEDIARVNQRAETEVPARAEESLLERAQRMMDSAAASIDVQAYIERYKAAAADASEHAINLIVIFTLQTILLPLFLLWLLIRLLKRVVHLRLTF
jgi:hypothetical protein